METPVLFARFQQGMAQLSAERGKIPDRIWIRGDNPVSYTHLGAASAGAADCQRLRPLRTGQSDLKLELDLQIALEMPGLPLATDFLHWAEAALADANYQRCLLYTSRCV